VRLHSDLAGCQDLGGHMKDKDTYLGDGVYASFDGFQIWLTFENHENNQVAIDSDVMKSLLAYAEKVWKENP
jgi:hypothetical protein